MTTVPGRRVAETRPPSRTPGVAQQPRHARGLTERGWHFDRQDDPPALHLMASPRHLLVVDEFLADLRASLADHPDTSTTAATYGDDVSAETAAR